MKKTRETQISFKTRESFDSSTSKGQVIHVHMVLVLQTLYQLRSDLLKILEPDKAFQHTLEVNLHGSIWEQSKRWLLDNFIQNNDEHRTEVMDNINKLIGQYQTLVFEQKKWAKLATELI
jgi:hypothetical protein